MANNDRTELILSTIVVVLAPSVPPRLIDIEPHGLEAILRRPLTFSQSPVGPIITSNRDQIEIAFSSNRIDVRESSGDVAQAKSKISRIIHGFLALATLAEVSAQSYGVNFISEINVERPHEWLGNNLLNPNLASKFGTSFSSNLVTLILDRPPKVWTVRFEARPGDRFSVNFNASENTGALPNQEKLEHDIEEQYKSLNEFLSQIGL